MATKGPIDNDVLLSIAKKHFGEDLESKILALISPLDHNLTYERLLNYTCVLGHEQCFYELEELKTDRTECFNTLFEIFEQNSNEEFTPPNPMLIHAVLAHKTSRDFCNERIYTGTEEQFYLKALIYAIVTLDIILYRALVKISPSNAVEKVGKIIEHSSYPNEYKDLSDPCHHSMNDKDIEMWLAAYIASEYQVSYLEDLLKNKKHVSSVNFSATYPTQHRHSGETALLHIVESTIVNHEDFLSIVVEDNLLDNINFNSVFFGTKISLFGCILEAGAYFPSLYTTLLEKASQNIDLWTALKDIDYTALGLNGYPVSSMLSQKAVTYTPALKQYQQRQSIPSSSSSESLMPADGIPELVGSLGALDLKP